MKLSDTFALCPLISTQQSVHAKTVHGALRLEKLYSTVGACYAKV